MKREIIIRNDTSTAVQNIKKGIIIRRDTSTATSLLLPADIDLTNEQVCKIIIALAKNDDKGNGGKDE